jgi:hypothetical protein
MTKEEAAGVGSASDLEKELEIKELMIEELSNQLK